jgi:acetyl esterase/lipase
MIMMTAVVIRVAIISEGTENMPAMGIRVIGFGPALTAAVLLFGPATLSAREPNELPIWTGVAPGSEGIDERELVVDRGKGRGYVDRSISNVHRPTITVHLPQNSARKLSAAIVICPGGGLTRVVVDKEGNDFAKFLSSRGVAGIVLKFRTVKSEKHFYGVSALTADVKRAIRLTRFHADKWKIDRSRIGVFGFSAGGHVASTAATHFDAGNLSSDGPVQRQSCRPDFAGFAYPLISLQTEVSGKKYQELLLGQAPSAARIREYSNELHVSSKTPPAFLCHAENDSAVKVENTRRFAAACKKAGVICTTFIRPRGGHGYGIRDQGDPINKWPYEFVAWLKQNGFVDSNQ